MNYCVDRDVEETFDLGFDGIDGCKLVTETDYFDKGNFR